MGKVLAIHRAPAAEPSFTVDANTDAALRTYYAHEGRNILLATQSEAMESRPATHESQSSFTYGVSRMRTRPREIRTWDSNTESMAITPVTPSNAPIIEVIGSPRRKVNQEWSPHLWHDRKSVINRRTIFIAPSLDEVAEGKAISRRNVQIWLFALGFILPLGMLHSFLLYIAANLGSLDIRFTSPSPSCTGHHAADNSKLTQYCSRHWKGSRTNWPSAIWKCEMVAEH